MAGAVVPASATPSSGARGTELASTESIGNDRPRCDAPASTAAAKPVPSSPFAGKLASIAASRRSPLHAELLAAATHKSPGQKSGIQRERALRRRGAKALSSIG